jgi:hypothetical protein
LDYGIRKAQRNVNRLTLWLGLAAVSATSIPTAAPAQALPVTEVSNNLPGHEFDFLYGQWSVRNRFLNKRLANSQEWTEFDASDAFHALPGNLGSEETYHTEHWPDYHAIGLHLYDPKLKRWKLYWADNRNEQGTMQTLATGDFAGNVGTFYAPDEFNGKSITVRILWKHLDQNHAHWEQAFSADQGVSWETNWTMDFTLRSRASN